MEIVYLLYKLDGNMYVKDNVKMLFNYQKNYYLIKSKKYSQENYQIQKVNFKPKNY